MMNPTQSDAVAKAQDKIWQAQKTIVLANLYIECDNIDSDSAKNIIDTTLNNPMFSTYSTDEQDLKKCFMLLDIIDAEVNLNNSYSFYIISINVLNNAETKLRSISS